MLGTDKLVSKLQEHKLLNKPSVKQTSSVRLETLKTGQLNTITIVLHCRHGSNGNKNPYCKSLLPLAVISQGRSVLPIASLTFWTKIQYKNDCFSQ
jgi:hypothetical protein